MIPPTFAILLWPVVTLVLFMRLDRPLAIMVSIVAGYLLLPVQGALDLPLLPPLDKDAVPAIMTLVLALCVTPKLQEHPPRPGLLPQQPVAKWLILLMFFGAVMTFMTNGDRLHYGPTSLQALTINDALSSIIRAFIMLIPLLLARKFLGHPDQQRQLLLVLCVSGLLYSLLALYEVRMSPQLNRTFYGFFPHDWIQHLRAGGFRPIVFLTHGLQVSIFFTGTILAVLGLMRAAPGVKKNIYVWGAIWLFGTLILSKSLGAMLIAVMLIPCVLLLNARRQLLISSILVVMVISYPLSRGAHIAPIDTIHQTASEFDPQRGQSLQVRLANEETMLNKAMERPLFGWGRWSRSRVFDERGNDTTTADGYWVISIGVGGWTQFLTEFLLMGGGVLLLFMRRKTIEVGYETAALSLIVTAWMIDLLPNSALTPLLWLTAGALWGRLEYGRVNDETEDKTPQAQTGTVYTRMPHRKTAKPLNSRSNATRPKPTTRPRSQYSRKSQI